ncbi:MAG: membrane dipeptidase [Clostridia bacterium]|nr:membrane dipeptidase [Clostridia bacterium]
MSLFDLHCDTLYAAYQNGYSLAVNPLHIDLTRGRLYTPWCQVFAVWVPDSLRGNAAFSFCCKVLEFARAEEAACSPRFLFARDGKTLKEEGHCRECVGILAVENGAAIGGKIENIAELAARGVRILTLTWNGENEWGYGCSCDARLGLKPFGKAALTALEEVGIIPDVSHLNEGGFWDVVAHTTKPFIATHSLSATVHPHPRNLNDRQFEEIVRRGGLVGLSLCGEHLGESSFDRVRRHAERFLSLGGEKTLALGGDLDGTVLPPEWQGIAVYEHLREYLSQKGWNDSLIEAVFFKNAANFLESTLHSPKLPV